MNEGKFAFKNRLAYSWKGNLSLNIDWTSTLSIRTKEIQAKSEG